MAYNSYDSVFRYSQKSSGKVFLDNTLHETKPYRYSLKSRGYKRRKWHSLPLYNSASFFVNEDKKILVAAIGLQILFTLGVFFASNHYFGLTIALEASGACLFLAIVFALVAWIYNNHYLRSSTFSGWSCKKENKLVSLLLPPDVVKNKKPTRVELPLYIRDEAYSAKEPKYIYDIGSNSIKKKEEPKSISHQN